MLLSIEGLWTVARIQARLAQSLGNVVCTLPRRWNLASAPETASATVEPQPASAPPGISIVIPALNEAENLPRVLETIQAAVQIEVVVVDGGSADATPQVAADWGARVVVSQPGRSHQMNQGAAIAKGPVLLFLHADTRLPEGFEHTVRQTLAQPDVVAGAFQLAIDSPRRALRWVEWGVNLRSRHGHMPYGDQGIFLKAEVFHNLGGFPDLPIMEDFELVRRLRQVGKIAIAPESVVTSDRRWRTLGVLRTTLANQLMVIGYLLGVDPHRLARWYRSLGKPQIGK